jgi:hypothetical protein
MINSQDIERSIQDLIMARKERDHARITAIEDYLADNNVEIDSDGDVIRWKT